MASGFRVVRAVIQERRRAALTGIGTNRQQRAGRSCVEYVRLLSLTCMPQNGPEVSAII
jgi:hypothetical protein